MDILNFLLKYINDKTLPVWIVLILIIAGIIVYEAIKSIPKFIQDNISDRREFGNTKQLQIESYLEKLVVIDWLKYFLNGQICLLIQKSLQVEFLMLEILIF